METRAYVRHRLHVAAGADRDVFTEAALRAVHRRTRGVPRLINVLCDRALLAGYVAHATRIGASIVKQAAREIPDTRRRLAYAPTSSASRTVAGAAARRLGAGAVFAAGLGLAVAAGLLVGSADGFRERLDPWVGSLGVPKELIGATVTETSVGSAPPFLTSSGPATLHAESPRDGGFDASTAVVVENPSAFEGQTLSPVDPEKVEEMSLAAIEGLSVGEFLGAVLGAEDEDVSRRGAINAILDSYGLAAFDATPLSDRLAVSWLGERGLSVLSLQDADLVSLRGLNYPALLRVRVDDGFESRLVALLRLEGDLASIHGVTEGPLWVPIDELLQQWDGDAWVVWNDFEAIRPVLAFGEQSHSVAWLQAALSELGYYQGNASGLFDGSTREGLRTLQRQQNLVPDGRAGPRTRMVLYDLLDRYDVPRLVASEGDAG
jgi:general secretion pathway protein A